MIKIVGVRFRTAGKVYYFGPKNLELKLGDHVVVETARGVELGMVAVEPKDVPDDEVVQPLKTVQRIATEDDFKRAEKNKEKEKEAFKVCQEKIKKHKLDMKLGTRNIHLITINYCSILRQMEELISVSW